MNRHIALFAGLFLCACASTPRVSGPPGLTDVPPGAVARNYYDAVHAAMQSGQWRSVVHLIHPESLSRTRAVVIALTSPGSEVPPPARPLSQASRTKLFSALRVGSVAELAALDSTVLFERLVTQVLPTSVTSVLAGVLGETTSDYLGVLAEGDTLAHVVRRVHYPGDPPSTRGLMGIVDHAQGVRMDVATLKRSGAQWRVLAETGFDLRVMLHLQVLGYTQ